MYLRKKISKRDKQLAYDLLEKRLQYVLSTTTISDTFEKIKTYRNVVRQIAIAKLSLK